MNLEGILSIAGKAGLFKMVSQAKNTVIVESLNDKKRFPLYASHQVSALEDIGIYTYSDTTPLSEIFDSIAIKEEGGACLNHKSSKDEMFSWMREVLPEFDEDQVYHSDIKKVAQWYNVLQENGLVEVPKKKTDKKTVKKETPEFKEEK
jgi:hypothetical protein